MFSEGKQSEEDKITTFIVGGQTFTVPKKYRLTNGIGEGAYGCVCAAQNLETNELVAIKKIPNVFGNPIETKRTIREIRLLRHFQKHEHENIIEIRNVITALTKEEFRDIYIVNELMDTDLHLIIASKQPLSNDHVQYFVYQILRGLLYIHSANVLHRDLKPSNLLVNSNCDLKICDFGLSRVATPEENKNGFLTEYVATRWYRAPEIMLSWTEYTKAIDVWSVGCIFAELLLRRPLFPGRDYMHQLHLILDTIGTPSHEDSEYIASDKAKAYIRSLKPQPGKPFEKVFPGNSKEAIDLLKQMLTFNPSKRITVAEALRHPYLKGLHDPEDEPVAEEMFDFSSFSFEENKNITIDELKEILWEEATLWQNLHKYNYINIHQYTEDVEQRQRLQEQQLEQQSNQFNNLPHAQNTNMEIAQTQHTNATNVQTGTGGGDVMEDV